MKDSFKIGEISKLYKIGPDSLRYYEELGILTPKRGPNGYRQYSTSDLWRINVIRDLRELNFSMDKIKEYLDDRSIESTEALLQEELDIINRKISSLEELQKNVTQRLFTLTKAKQQPTGLIQSVVLPQRNCYVIPSGYKTDEEMDMLIKQLLNRDQKNLYIIGNNRIGSFISLEQARQKKFRDYYGVFIIDDNGDTALESGHYLSLCYRGDCNQNSIYIPKLFSFAKKQNLTLTGPVLELIWTDIHQSERKDEHITELQIRYIS